LRLEKKGLKIAYESGAKVFHSHQYDEKNFGRRMKRVGRSAIALFKKYENDKKTLHMLKMKYALFCYFPGLKVFYRISKLLAKCRIIKIINPKYGWFWQVCQDYSSGMVEESNK
jgi:hypothetical protein